MGILPHPFPLRRIFGVIRSNSFQNTKIPSGINRRGSLDTYRLQNCLFLSDPATCAADREFSAAYAEENSYFRSGERPENPIGDFQRAAGPPPNARSDFGGPANQKSADF